MSQRNAKAAPRGRGKHPGQSPAHARFAGGARAGARDRVRGGGRSVGPGSRLARALVWPASVLGQALALLGVVVLAALWLLEDRAVPVPEVLAQYAERRAEAALDTQLELSGMRVTAQGAGIVRLVAEGVRLIGPDGQARASLPVVTVALGMAPARSLAPEIRTLAVEGAVLRVARRADGTLDLGSDVLSAIFARNPPRTPVEAADRVRSFFARPALARVREVSFEGLSFSFSDARTGRSWTVPDASLQVQRAQQALSITLALEQPGRIALRATMPDLSSDAVSDGRRETGQDAGPDTGPDTSTEAAADVNPLDLQVSVLLGDVPAQDIAAQVPALVWLAPLQADVSGALIAHYASDGRLGRLDGTLEVGAGRLALGRDAASDAGSDQNEGPDGAGQFDSAQAYFTYRPDPARISFSQLSVTAPQARFVADGHAYLHAEAGMFPHALTTQLQLREGWIAGGLPVPRDVSLTHGALDARVAFDPFEVDIGQLVVETPAAIPTADAPTLRLQGRGRIETRADGVAASLSVDVPRITPRELLGLWPEPALAGTRDWLVRNVESGQLLGTRAGLSIQPGAPPEVALSFRFRDAVVRVLRDMPPITGGAGRASLGADRFSIALEDGRIVVPAASSQDGPGQTGDGGAIDLAGTSFTIPDTRQRPGIGELAWTSRSTIPAALDLLDRPPLLLMQRAGRSTDLATGEVALSGDLRFPIRRGVTAQDLAFDVSARLTDVRSDALVPGRMLAAEALALRASSTGLEISGDVLLGDVAARMRYAQPFGPDAEPPEVQATVALSAQMASALGASLPAGAVSGTSAADLTLWLPPGAPPSFELTSDLRGLGLRFDPIGLTKRAQGDGRFELAGTLGAQGQPPRIDRLALSAPGLDVAGRLQVAPGGGLGTLTLDRARVGGWLDAAVVLRGRGAGRVPDIELRGGTVDLRRVPQGATGGSGGELGAELGGTLAGRLDRVVLADGIALTDVQLDLDGAGGLSGQLSGRVNGGARVSGSVPRVQARDGPMTVRISAPDAGGVLAAAGVFEEAQGGVLEATLSPEARDGHWSGTLAVDGMRVTAAPGLAALLNTISVVGLIDQLNGPGLAFSQIRSAFRLTPDGVEITSASAVGPSLGVSAEGILDAGAGRIDLRGVLSPVYFINAIGQLFTREGEGLFGMTYSVTGPVDSPEIRVNPLALLTPGAFREIFRTAPPELPSDGAVGQ